MTTHNDGKCAPLSAMALLMNWKYALVSTYGKLKAALPAYLAKVVVLLGLHNRLSNRLGCQLENLIKLKLFGSYMINCKVRDISVRIGVSSELELSRTESYESKEPETLDWMSTFSKNDVFFDVGANIGLYTCFAGLKTKCKVFAFEPESQNFARLNYNIALNSLQDVVAYPFCVGDKAELGKLYVTSLESGDSQHNYGEKNPFINRELSLVQGTMLQTLDELCYSSGLPVPTHLKIDVDGLEDKILIGAQKILQDQRLKSILVEINIVDGHIDPLRKQIEEAGFFLERMSDREHRTGNITAKNHIFVRR